MVPGVATWKSSVSVRFDLLSWTTHTPPPPRLADDGNVTESANATATAASAAVPPAERISRPTSDARGSSVATPPRNPCTNPMVPRFDSSSLVWNGLMAASGFDEQAANANTRKTDTN